MYGKIAAEADNQGRYQDAVDNYLKAVEIFTYMIKCKLNQNIYITKFGIQSLYFSMNFDLLKIFT